MDTKTCFGQGNGNNHGVKAKMNEDNLVYKNLLILKSSMDVADRRFARDVILNLPRDKMSALISDVLQYEDDTEILAYCAEILASKYEEKPSELLISLANHPDSEIRRHVLGLLSKYMLLSINELMILRLKGDPSANVRVVAAFGLGKLGFDASIPFLEAVVENDFERDQDGTMVSESAQIAIERIKLNK